MADRAFPLRAAAAGVAAVILALTLGTLAAVLWRAQGFHLSPADWAAVRFTLLQAALSAGLAVALAIPVARALARRRFAGRGLLISLLGAPFLLPVLVAVLGMLALFGRSGLVNQGLALLGLPSVSIYGLHGVVLAHLFLNLPFAVRMILQGWQTIPAKRFRLAAALGLSPAATFRHLELPMLRSVVPGAALVIFVLCLTSFAVALTLGGGPRATTVELAIYQALRFDYDLGRAAGLALMQFALCLSAVGLAGWAALPSGFGAGTDGVRRGTLPGWRRVADALAISLAAAFLLVPLGLVTLQGLPGLTDLPATVWPAALRSLAVALVATVLCTTAGLVVALTVAEGARWVEAVAMLPLAASGLVLGTGLFLLVHPLIAPERLALPVTVLVNATLALPFVVRLLLPEARSLRADYGRLAGSLGLTGIARLRWVTLPRLARPLGFGAGVAAALSMGDLGVIALFAGEGGATLPLVVQRLMSSYRMEAAAGTTLLLISLSLALFALFDGLGRRHAAT